LGTNGSGKSKLIKECTPLPATPVNFVDGGEKWVDFNFNGDKFRCVSYVGKSAKHTLFKNSVEVHSLVTTNVHKQYIEDSFKYDNNVHKLLIGELKFTQMTPQARKDILTLITPLSLDYALAFHRELKERIKETHILIKHIVVKSASTKTKLNSLEIPDNLNELKARIEAEVDKLLPFSMMEVKQSVVDLKSLRDTASQIRSTFVQKFDNRRVPVEDINDLDDLKNYTESLNLQLAVTQSEIDILTQELYTLSEYKLQCDIGELSTNDIKGRIAHIKGILQSNFYFKEKEYKNHTLILSSINTIESTLCDIYSWLPEKYIVVSERSVIEQRYKTLCSNKNYCEVNISRLEEQLTHYKSSETITDCPRCEYKFNANWQSVDKEIISINKKLEDLHGKLKELPEKIEEYRILNDDVTRIISAEQKLLQLKRTTPECSEFWTQFISDEDILFSRDLFRSKLLMYLSDVQYANNKVELEMELAIYEKSLSVSTQYGVDTSSRENTLTQTLVEKRKLVTSLNGRLTECKSLQKYILYFENLSKKYDEVQLLIRDKLIENIEVGIKTSAKSRVNYLYGKINEYNDLVTKVNHLTTSIEELEVEQNALTDKLKSLIVAEEIISPSKGLIASQMKGFIDDYITRLNRVCNSVWTYPLSIEACDLTNDSLNYTFPLVVKNTTIPDIIDASKSQKEMVNLAFTIVMREYLGLSQYPLFLDETGAEFDDTHRAALISYMKEILSSNKCSQMFFINHYDTMFGAFTNADTVVLDATNVTVAKPYNQHVLINQPHNPK
jgi:hypothetical protein